MGEHDNGQPRWNASDNLNSLGAPLDYRDRKEVDLEQAQSVVRSAQYKSSFIAIMVSMHCHKLYSDSQDAKVQSFLSEQATMREGYMKLNSLSSKVISQCYQFLRFCDDLSLALCQDESCNKKVVSIDPILGEEEVKLSRNDDGSYSLDPWIFYEDKLIFPIEYFQTSKKIYKDDEDLKKDIDILRPYRSEFVFVR
ncbi:DUF3891 family protein [Algoriphagus aquimarinus]|uniref:DUF3891 family protein n=1 Tax=Algoriphagus aquimarinus TaxID=237018 RepID=UPI0030DA60D9